jgi:hypothetical protein
LFLAAGASAFPLPPDGTAPVLAEPGISASDIVLPMREGGAAATGTSRTRATPAKPQNALMAADAELAASQPMDKARKEAIDAWRAKAAASSPNVGAKSAAHGLPIDNDIDPDLKDAAKAALELAREARQWMDPTRPGAAADAGQEPGAPQGSVPQKEGGAVATESAARPNVNADPDLDYPSTPEDAQTRALRTGERVNLIREATKNIREFVEHPLTWLMITIVALGAFALQIAQYRGQAGRRSLGRRHGARRRLPSESNRGLTEGRVGRASGRAPASSRSKAKLK